MMNVMMINSSKMTSEYTEGWTGYIAEAFKSMIHNLDMSMEQYDMTIMKMDNHMSDDLDIGRCLNVRSTKMGSTIFHVAELIGTEWCVRFVKHLLTETKYANNIDYGKVDLFGVNVLMSCVRCMIGREEMDGDRICLELFRKYIRNEDKMSVYNHGRFGDGKTIVMMIIEDSCQLTTSVLFHLLTTDKSYIQYHKLDKYGASILHYMKRVKVSTSMMVLVKERLLERMMRGCPYPPRSEEFCRWLNLRTTKDNVSAAYLRGDVGHVLDTTFASFIRTYGSMLDLTIVTHRGRSLLDMCRTADERELAMMFLNDK